MVRAESIGRPVQVTREPLDCSDVSAYSCLREVASLEFLQHDFAKTGHRDLLVTRTLLLAREECLYLPPTRSVRRTSGFVQVLGLYRKRSGRHIFGCALKPRGGSVFDRAT